MTPVMDEVNQKYEIVETANKLFIYTDQRNWEGVRVIFADEVLFDMTSMSGGSPVRLTPKQITDMWEEGLRKLKAIHHQVGNYLVTVRNEDADLFCYGIALHYLPNRTKENIRAFVGSYDLHFLKTEHVWKIDHFKFNLKFIEGNKDLEKFVE
jgi:hypothetical protein